MTHPTPPQFSAGGPRAEVFRRLYDSALANLRSNTVRDPEGPGLYVRAGAGYQDPWTRDASINSWFAGSLVDRESAEYTLDRVTEPLAPADGSGDGSGDGDRVLAQDNQWWDQAIWVIGAWNHYLVTGSRDFLESARKIAERSLALLRAAHFDEELGLYLGPAFMQDGISGLPTPPNDPALDSSFVLDYPKAWSIATLSTNALYVGAYRALAAMARELGLRDGGAAADAEAERLSGAIRRRFARDSMPPHFLYRDESGAVQSDDSEEAAGVAFATLVGVFSPGEGATHLAGLWHEPAGVVNVWPHFTDRYSDERPGRHNVLCWPVVMGLVNLAAADVDRTLFGRGLDDLVALVGGSDDEFFELYNARSGAPDGGWQVGRQWESEPDQTWSATAFLASVHAGVLGLKASEAGLAVQPWLPQGLDSVRVEGLRYRGSVLTVEVRRDAAAGGAAEGFVPAATAGPLSLSLTVG